tara:strand:- start:560 stop:1300 length:741 start_codon:yes stop_codon:yes gene_type:complete
VKPKLILKNTNNFHLIKFHKIKIKLIKYSFGNVSLKKLIHLPSEIELFDFFYKNRNFYEKVCDVGANVGLHSIFMAKLFKKVGAYEPYNKHLKILKKNKKINNCNNLKIYSKAVSNSSSSKILNVLEDNTTASHLAKSTRSKYGRINRIKVKCEKFSNIVDTYDLIKLDIEGLEGLILKNIKFKKNFPDFLIEIHNKKNARQIYDRFKIEKKYKIYKIKNNKKILIKNFKEIPKFTIDGTLLLKNE